eukprot:356275-Chlamydomonas_euryale.AAC.10
MRAARTFCEVARAVCGPRARRARREVCEDSRWQWAQDEAVVVAIVSEGARSGFGRRGLPADSVLCVLSGTDTPSVPKGGILFHASGACALPKELASV